MKNKKIRQIQAYNYIHGISESLVLGLRLGLGFVLGLFHFEEKTNLPYLFDNKHGHFKSNINIYV